jgi:hypothetical protein
MVYNFILPSPGSIDIASIIMFLTGVSLIFLGIFGRRKNENTRGIKNTSYILIVTGLVIIVVGIFLFFALSAPYSVIIGNGYIYVNGPMIGGGSINVTSNEIANAYVGNIVTGNLTISVRTGGTSIGNLNAGKFLLSNNASAYLASENNTDVIIRLKSGEYFIIGNNDTYLLASTVSRYVYNISGYPP